MSDIVFMDAIKWKKETEKKRKKMEVREMIKGRKKSLAEEAAKKAAEEVKRIYLIKREAEFHKLLAGRTPEEKNLAICQPLLPA